MSHGTRAGRIPFDPSPPTGDRRPPRVPPCASDGTPRDDEMNDAGSIAIPRWAAVRDRGAPRRRRRRRPRCRAGGPRTPRRRVRIARCFRRPCRGARRATPFGTRRGFPPGWTRASRRGPCARPGRPGPRVPCPPTACTPRERGAGARGGGGGGARILSLSSSRASRERRPRRSLSPRGVRRRPIDAA